MKVILTSPEQTREMIAEWVECTGTTGNYLILPGHNPFIEQLAIGKQISIKLRQGAVKSFMVHRGIVSVDRDEIVIIMEDPC